MMKQALGIIIGLVIVVILFLLYSATFIVTEREQAVVTQFGRPVGVIAGESPLLDKDKLSKSVQDYAERNNNSVYVRFGAGLYFKTPFIQEVVFFDNRLLEYDSNPESITTLDKKRVVVDNFARWRISDPLKYLQRVQTEPQAQSRLDDIIYSILRSELGEYDFIEIIRSTNNLLKDKESEVPNAKLVSIEQGRTEIMQKVAEMCNKESEQEYGIQILDVRVKRADLPEQNMQSVFENMASERQRIAAKYREEGKRDAAIIRAQTDREVRSMIAEAEQKAKVIYGEADAEAAQIYADGFVNEDENGNKETVEGFKDHPAFFRYIRSLEALEMSMDSETSFILDTNNELMKMLERPYEELDQ